MTRNLPYYTSVLLKLVVVPITLSLVALHYLLRPGYAGFGDNPGVAPSLEQYLKTVTGPWGFWAAYGMGIETMINLLLNDKVTSWKVTIFVYQYLSFITAYLALRKLGKLISYERMNKGAKLREVTIYTLSIAYSFNVYVIGGLFNYFLPQFEIPYIFAPLYLAYLINIYFHFNKSKKNPSSLSFKRVMVESLKLALVGIFISSSPVTVVMFSLILVIIYLDLIFSTRRIFYLLISLITVLFLSNIYLLIDVYYYQSDPSIQRFLAGAKPRYPGLGLVYVLTSSYPSLRDIPSSLPAYFPLSLFFWSSLIWIGRFTRGSLATIVRRLLLDFTAGLLLLIPFLNGFKGALSPLLDFMAEFIPSIIMWTFVNEIVNLEYLFSILFIPSALLLLIITTIENSERVAMRRTILPLLLLILLTAPILYNYFYIQTEFYSKRVNPTPIPSYYDPVFEFIKTNTNATYLWIPFKGTPEWRGTRLFAIPIFLGLYYFDALEGKLFLNPWTQFEAYLNLVKSLNAGRFPKDLINKFNIKYIIIDRSVTNVNLEGIIKYLESDGENFRRVAEYGYVLIYEVIHGEE